MVLPPMTTGGTLSTIGELFTCAVGLSICRIIDRPFRLLMMVLVVLSHSTDAPSASKMARKGASVRPSRMTGGTSKVRVRPLTSTLIGWLAETGIEHNNNMTATKIATKLVVRTIAIPPPPRIPLSV